MRTNKPSLKRRGKLEKKKNGGRANKDRSLYAVNAPLNLKLKRRERVGKEERGTKR